MASWSLTAQESCEEYVRANEFFQQRDLAGVLSVYREISQGDGCSAQVRFLLGRSYLRTTEYDSAQLHLENAANAFEQMQLADWKAEAAYWLGRTLRSAKKYDRSLDWFFTSLSIYDSLGLKSRHARSLNAIANLYAEQGETDKSLEYRRAYVEAVKPLGDTRRLAIAYINLASTTMETDIEQSRNHYLQGLDLLTGINEPVYEGIVHQNLGVLYSEKLQQFDSAIYHYSQARTIYEQTGTDYTDLNINLGAIYFNQGRYKRAERLYLESLAKADSTGDFFYQKILLENLSEVYESLGHYKLAFDYQKRFQQVASQLMDEEKARAIVEAETRYQTSEKEKQIIALERDNERAELQRQRATTIQWITILVLALVAVLAYFLIKTYRSGKLIAEQKSRLDKQKVMELMRQQELIGFDAMVLGQNNERKRIAEALHDHLGSLMATLKLGFEGFWIKFNGGHKHADQAYNKLIGQIDEACDEVRRVSHNTRSGILISEGLLPAIQKLAENISDSGGLKVEVSGFGLNKGLDGTIELGIYRVVQELLANIIKHAAAQMAMIQLTMHEGSLNILVEDDGCGFAQEEVPEGVGLKSMRSRVNYLQGEMMIDSTIGKGTTVSLDIPIK